MCIRDRIQSVFTQERRFGVDRREKAVLHYRILKLAAGLYDKYALKRVFYSAYIPVVEDSLLTAVDTKPCLLYTSRCV